MKRGPKKGEGGAPLKSIDMEKLDKLCSILCTEKEIADIFDMTMETLNQKIKAYSGKTFLDYYKQKSANGKMSLRRVQLQTALGKPPVFDRDGALASPGTAPNPTMLIWLGKQYLGQSDKQEIEHSGSVTIIDDIPRK